MPLGDVSTRSLLFKGSYTNTEVAEECFALPDNFIPERWSSQPELIKEHRAFAPFSLGMFPFFLELRNQEADCPRSV